MLSKRISLGINTKLYYTEILFALKFCKQKYEFVNVQK